MNTTTQPIAESNRSIAGKSQEDSMVLRHNRSQTKIPPNLSK